MQTSFKNRRWLVISSTLVESIDFNQVFEFNQEALRYSVDGTKTFIKYEIQIVEEDLVSQYINAETGEAATHTTLAGVYGRPAIWQEGMVEYTHEEILALLATEEWTKPFTENRPV